MYVREICAEGIFVNFPWWLENVKSRSKIAFFFSNERHFEIGSPKKRTITFFWSKLSKLHVHTKKKDPILHVATTFSLKQGETRTRNGTIPHPLICLNGFPKVARGDLVEILIIWLPKRILNINNYNIQLLYMNTLGNEIKNEKKKSH